MSIESARKTEHFDTSVVGRRSVICRDKPKAYLRIQVGDLSNSSTVIRIALKICSL